jgi:hypothetical protein
MPVYFARPYHSWERGTNENTNGLLREYFPKGTSLTDLTQEDVDNAVHLLNTRPRKRLGYRTPEEVFNAYAVRTLIYLGETGPSRFGDAVARSSPQNPVVLEDTKRTDDIRLQNDYFVQAGRVQTSPDERNRLNPEVS